VIQQRVHRFLGTIDKVNDTSWKADLLDQLKDTLLHDRILLRGFEDEGIPAGNRIGPEPEGDHERKVEWGYGSEDAQRLKDDLFIDAACCSVFQAVAHHERRDAASGLDIFDAALHLTTGIIERLAHLGGDQAG